MARGWEPIIFAVRYHCGFLVGAVAKCGWDRNVTLPGDEMRRRLYTTPAPSRSMPLLPSNRLRSIRYGIVLCMSGRSALGQLEPESPAEQYCTYVSVVVTVRFVLH